MGIPRRWRPAAPPPAPSRPSPRGGRCRRAGHPRAGGRRGRRRPSWPRRRAAWRASRRCGRREPRRRRGRRGRWRPPPRAPNAIASCEPSGLKASPLTRGGRCSGGPISFRPSRSQIRTAPPPAPEPPTPAAASRPPGPKASASTSWGLSRSGPRGALRSGPTRLPDPASQRPTPPPPPATASRRPSGEYSIASADLPAKASKPPVRRSVSASIRSTLPSDLGGRERAPVGAEGEGGRGGLARVVDGVGAEGPPEPAVAGHVPDSRGRVVARRVEGAPVGAERLAPDRAIVALEGLDRPSLPQVPDDHVPRHVRRSPACARRG